jgi:8-oxo-dGTP diphosphatase
MSKSEEKTLFEATLCYLVQGERVLLAKKTKKIGAGCWNGYGGGIEAGETAEEAAVRELAEESGGVTATVEALDNVAILDMENHKADGEVFSCTVYVYIVRQWVGTPEATDEMVTPTWFSFDDLPLDELMPADKIWLPLILAGKRLKVSAVYGPFQQELLGEMRIEEVKNF